MTRPRNEAFMSVLVQALARSGVAHASIAPGSRNSPISLTLAAHPAITDWSHHDERSAAFFALGLAKTTLQPVAIVTTSGTAAAEVLPALVEADAAGVPLIVLTADRPTELWDVGAAQTVDQRHLFTGVLRWQHDLDVPDPADAGAAVTAALGARLVTEADGIQPGPVHLNVRFRPPLVVEPDFESVPIPEVIGAEAAPTPGDIEELATALSGRNGVIVAGPQHDPEVAAAIQSGAAALGWPILADPISGLRAGGSVERVVGSDLLAAAGFVGRAAPDAVIRVGAPPTSKALRSWLAETSAQQVVIDAAGWRDPDAVAGTIVRGSPRATLQAVAGAGVEPSEPGWIDRWIKADRRACEAAAAVIEAGTFPSEPGIALALARSLPGGTTLWTASSMPIRDIDDFFPVTERSIRIMGNRGANGIDGFLSSALGSAAAGQGTVAHAGDLSVLHDVGALATAARLDLPMTILAVNNDGGGIFHFLPQEGNQHFERHFGTPHGLSFTEIGRAFGLDSTRVDQRDQLEDLVASPGAGPRLLEVVTDRRTNVAIHEEIMAAVRQRLKSN